MNTKTRINIVGLIVGLSSLSLTACDVDSEGFDEFELDDGQAYEDEESDTRLLPEPEPTTVDGPDTLAAPEAGPEAVEVAGGPTLSCSSEYASGWCQHLLDGLAGTCNLGEWATASESTGSVNLTWINGTSISGLTLYDRACPENVLSGRVELWFYNPNHVETIYFDELDEGGTFIGPELPELSWDGLHIVKVFIDEAEGGPNPGLSEVVVHYADDC